MAPFSGTICVAERIVKLKGDRVAEAGNYPAFLPWHFLHTFSVSPVLPLAVYKSLIRVLPQKGQVPLPREGMRHSALPRLFFDIPDSLPLSQDKVSYAENL